MADAVYLEVFFDKFTPTLGQGMRVHADERGDVLIAAVAEFERFQPGVETPLLFMKLAEKQQNGRLHLARYLLRGDRTGRQVRIGIQHSPSQQLAFAHNRFR